MHKSIILPLFYTGVKLKYLTVREPHMSRMLEKNSGRMSQPKGDQTTRIWRKLPK